MTAQPQPGRLFVAVGVPDGSAGTEPSGGRSPYGRNPARVAVAEIKKHFLEGF